MPGQLTATLTPPERKRRPQWRGERDAVLVRLPVRLAEQLRAEPAARQQSVSDTAEALIQAGISGAGDRR